MKYVFCNFCGHAHTQAEVVLSVLLKGFATLMGVNDSAFGLSCIHPECEKTFFIRVTEKEFQWIVDNIITDPFVAYPTDAEHPEKVTETIAYTTYGYHVPSFYFDEENDIFTSYMVRSYPLSSKRESLEGLENNIILERSNPELKDFWCSFLPDFMLPVQPQSKALLFNRNDLMSLLEIENLDRMRVFPRYIPINSHYEKAEQLSVSRFFCMSIRDYDIEYHPDETLSKQHLLAVPEGIIVGNLKYVETSILPETYGAGPAPF